MLILEPQHVGQTVSLYAPRELSCTVTAPDGSVEHIDTPEKRVDIHLEMVGTYSYVWSDGTTGEIRVIEAAPPGVIP